MNDQSLSLWSSYLVFHDAVNVSDMIQKAKLTQLPLKTQPAYQEEHNLHARNSVQGVRNWHVNKD